MTIKKIWCDNRADFKRLNELVLIENCTFIQNLSVDLRLVNSLQKLLLNSCVSAYLLKKITKRPNDKPWYDLEIRHFSKYRDRQRAIALKTKKKNDWIKYKKKLKKKSE